MPFRRSASGSVRAASGSITVRSGQWKAPTRFFPSGRSIAVLPPIAASTWPTSVVGTATQGTPRRYVGGDEPGGVGGRAAAERDERARLGRAAARATAARTSERLRLLPGGQLVRRCSRRAERELRVGAVDPGTRASATSATGPSPGTSSPRQLERAESRRWTPAAASTTPSASRARASATAVVERPPLARRSARNSASSSASGRPAAAHALPGLSTSTSRAP